MGLPPKMRIVSIKYEVNCQLVSGILAAHFNYIANARLKGISDTWICTQTFGLVGNNALSYYNQPRPWPARAHTARWRSQYKTKKVPLLQRKPGYCFSKN
jgi:hypothetical protein